MPKINISVAHQLNQDEALRRVKKLLTEVKTRHAEKISNLQEQWTGNVGTFDFSAIGFSVSGTLAVRRNSLEMIGKIPLLATPFKGKIESTIREQAEAILAT